MAPSFTQRQVRLTIALASGTNTPQPASFAENQNNQLVLPIGLRTSTRIENSGAPVLSEANVSVYGLRQSLTNQLSTLGVVINLQPRNSLLIEARDPQVGFVAVFSGEIIRCWADYSAAPDVPMRIQAQALAFASVQKTDATSVPGSADVAQVMSGLAQKIGAHA
jgi:hypothetical protein